MKIDELIETLTNRLKMHKSYAGRNRMSNCVRFYFDEGNGNIVELSHQEIENGNFDKLKKYL
jgi:hypothetical protein